jgi:predicted RNA methylase
VGQAVRASRERDGDAPIWSSSDFPYQCLLDFKRTTTLQAAIHATVREGDVVLDAGAGSGILSFFAAQAGAEKVYAVEVDQHLATCLKRSVEQNGLVGTIEVIHGDAHSARLPRDMDVFICEMMDTGLMDEMQVTVINSLRQSGVLNSHSRLIPFQYETFVEFGYTDFSYYGFKLLMPKHDWSHYASGGNGWLSTAFYPHFEPYRTRLTDFQEPIEPEVEQRFSLTASSSGLVNAVRISARAHLTKGLVLGATNALNGDKVIPLERETRVEEGSVYRAQVRYRMGGGLNSLVVRIQE